MARAAGRYLTRGESHADVYVRGGLATGDVIPGLTDVDLVLVVADDPAGRGLAAERVRVRWRRLRRGRPGRGVVVDTPRVYERDELRDLAGATALTYGLDSESGPRACYLADGGRIDRRRMLERPSLYGESARWLALAGPDRRYPEPSRDAQHELIAAWLELVYWWRWVFPACLHRPGPRISDLCVKFVAEPARIWLWLACGERVEGRREVLELALRHMPAEEDGLRWALALLRSLARSPAAPLAEALPVMLRLSARIGSLIAAAVEGEGVTEVRLAGAVPERPHAGPLPLVDWRGVVEPGAPEEALLFLPGSPGDPVALAAAAAQGDTGPYPALRGDALIVLPAPAFEQSRMRALKCPTTDPVSFALAGGLGVAAFPDVAGWSARDMGRRAVAEHAARLAAPEADGAALATLLSAARAGLFLDSVEEGEPELALTVAETAQGLAARSPAARTVIEDSAGRYRDLSRGGAEQPQDTVSALRRVVLKLPAYTGPLVSA